MNGVIFNYINKRYIFFHVLFSPVCCLICHVLLKIKAIYITNFPRVCKLLTVGHIMLPLCHSSPATRFSMTVNSYEIIFSLLTLCLFSFSSLFSKRKWHPSSLGCFQLISDLTRPSRHFLWSSVQPSECGLQTQQNINTMSRPEWFKTAQINPWVLSSAISRWQVQQC